MKIPFDNTYGDLPAQMFTRLRPTAVSDPSLIAFNAALADDLGITAGDDAQIATVFSGNQVPDGADPLAQLYAGHQFGNWNPQLGDGRALLLGEVTDKNGTRRDIQLKGSGPTPYSRSGDGRAWLGPVLREYLVSEAMHALGVPTTRALAAVRTADTVIRETLLPGAVLTRVASSHIRVGTFQIYAARGDKEALAALYDYTVARHYPDVTDPSGLLTAVLHRQAALVARWMGLGFIHGVMNTDNVSVAGETIDYGPCAFMDTYHPDTVFSAIDQYGRYAYSNQPGVAVWNLTQFATALIPLMPDQDEAIENFTTIINTFSDVFDGARRDVFAAKLGLTDATADDNALIDDFLTLMARDGADFTNSFAALATDTLKDQFVDQPALQAWETRWRSRLTDNSSAIMAKSNPLIIPRNHHVEAVIAAGVAGDDAPFHAMLNAVTRPYAALTPETAPFAQPPAQGEAVTQTFCGT
ncbi:protein adenylyltransferase SelO [Yoonia sp. 208BN28-4]|uniref:protein adenylyltransferase SelO n=1 Tax=Yoonia sp. 208BN28-4 TaxID=3126505 RepID=UPI003094D6FD